MGGGPLLKPRGLSDVEIDHLTKLPSTADTIGKMGVSRKNGRRVTPKEEGELTFFSETEQGEDDRKGNAVEFFGELGGNLSPQKEKRKKLKRC